jgi:hypothetical protein
MPPSIGVRYELLVPLGRGAQATVWRARDTNPEEQANCVCTFDLSIVVNGLAAGTYTVEVYDADGNLVGSSPVTV